MRNADILRRFGTLRPEALEVIELPPGTCSGCGKVHYIAPAGLRGCADRAWRLTAKGWAATDAAAVTSQDGQG